MPSCLALGSRPVSHDVAVLGGAPWAVELFLDLVANAAREAVAGGSLQGSSAGDLEGSRAEGSLMDQATIRLAVLLVIWHTLPARTRAALLAATCQVLEGVVRTLGSLEPHPIRPGSAAEAANARSLLLGLLGYQLANWGQPASPRAVKAVALVTRSKALANPCSSDESLDSVGLRLMVSEWTSLLSSTSHAKSFPGASSVRNAATALSSASPALSLLGQVGSASLVGSSAGTAPVSLAAALAGDVWADAKSAAVSVSPAACVPGDNWKLEAPESLWEWLCRSVDCLSQVIVTCDA